MEVCMVPEISALRAKPSSSDNITADSFSHVACSLGINFVFNVDKEVAFKVGPAGICIKSSRNEEMDRPIELMPYQNTRGWKIQKP